MSGSEPFVTFSDDPRIAMYAALPDRADSATTDTAGDIHVGLGGTIHLGKAGASAYEPSRKIKPSFVIQIATLVRTVLVGLSKIVTVFDQSGRSELSQPEDIAKAMEGDGYGFVTIWPVRLSDLTYRKEISLSDEDLESFMQSILLHPDAATEKSLTDLKQQALKVLSALNKVGWLRLVRSLGPQLAPQLDRALVEIGATRDQLPSVDRSPPYDGRKVVVGVVDYGCDFAHPNFRRSGGGTRIRLLWDQNGPMTTWPFPSPIGRRIDRDDIDEALRPLKAGEVHAAYVDVDDLPYHRLGYHPHDNYYQDDVAGGAHGTYVTDVAIGNGRATLGETVFRPGVAPESEIVFVQVRKPELVDNRPVFDPWLVVLGVAEVFAFADRCGLPAVVNISLNGTEGAHDGKSFFDQALNYLCTPPGRAIVVGAGNFYELRGHARGLVRDRAPVGLTWRFVPSDERHSEVEIWYGHPLGNPHRLTVKLSLVAPSGKVLVRDIIARPGDEDVAVMRNGVRVGTISNLDRDPDSTNPFSLRRMILLSVKPHAKGEEPKQEDWRITLEVEDAAALDVEIPFNAWISRDDKASTHFAEGCAEPHQTLGTLACFEKAIVVGAYAFSGDSRLVCPFSSAGPTRDNRHVPHIAAPGRGVWAARSTGFRLRYPGTNTQWRTSAAFVMDGTSTAAPFVTGSVALMLQKNPGLTAEALRRLLMDTAREFGKPGWDHQSGAGLLRTNDAVAAVP